MDITLDTTSDLDVTDEWPLAGIMDSDLQWITASSLPNSNVDDDNDFFDFAINDFKFGTSKKTPLSHRLKVGMIVNTSGYNLGFSKFLEYGTIVKITERSPHSPARNAFDRETKQFHVQFFSGREKTFSRSHTLVPCPERYLTKDVSNMSQDCINTYEFFLAVGKNDLKTIGIMLKEETVAVDIKFPEFLVGLMDFEDTYHLGATALMYAVTRKRADLISLLVFYGADVNEKGGPDNFPLMFIELNGEKSFYSRRSFKWIGNTQLHPQNYFDLKCCRALAKSGRLSASWVSPEGRSLLFRVMSEALLDYDLCTEIAAQLIQAGANVNHIDNEGCTPIWRCYENTRDAKKMQFLVENGADINICHDALAYIRYEDDNVLVGSEFSYDDIKPLLEIGLDIQYLQEMMNSEMYRDTRRFKNIPSSLDYIDLDEIRDTYHEDTYHEEYYSSFESQKFQNFLFYADKNDDVVDMLNRGLDFCVQGDDDRHSSFYPNYSDDDFDIGSFHSFEDDGFRINISKPKPKTPLQFFEGTHTRDLKAGVVFITSVISGTEMLLYDAVLDTIAEEILDFLFFKCDRELVLEIEERGYVNKMDQMWQCYNVACSYNVEGLKKAPACEWTALHPMFRKRHWIQSGEERCVGGSVKALWDDEDEENKKKHINDLKPLQ